MNCNILLCSLACPICLRTKNATSYLVSQIELIMRFSFVLYWLVVACFAVMSSKRRPFKKQKCRTCDGVFKNILNHFDNYPNTCGNTHLYSEVSTFQANQQNVQLRSEPITDKFQSDDGESRSDQDSLPAGYDSDNIDDLAGLSERNLHERKNHPLLGEMLDYQTLNTVGRSIYLQQDMSLMRIYDFCEDRCVARDFANDILKIIGEEMKENSFNPRTSGSMKSFMDRIQAQHTVVEPVFIPVVLETSKTSVNDRCNIRDVMDVATWSVGGQVISLLKEELPFSDLSNLVVNLKDPFLPYEHDSTKVDELLEGKWYADTTKEIIKDPTKEFNCPITLYMDKTGTDMYQRYPSEPLTMSLGIFRRHLRNQPRFQRILAYIPDIDLSKSSAAKRRDSAKKQSKGRSMRNFHKCMKVVTDAIKKADEEGIYTWLRMGDQVKYMRIRIPVSIIIGDAKSGDQLVGRKGSYRNANRISRQCTCSSKQADDAKHVCNWVYSSEVNELVDLALSDPPKKDKEKKAAKKTAIQQLEMLSTHVASNTFRETNFGYNHQGIHGATPCDLMHAFQLGIVRYVVQVVIGYLHDDSKVMLDNLVDRLFVGKRSGEKSEYPRIDFSRGFSNLTMVTADEWPGMLMAMIIAMRTKDGEAIFRTVFGDQDLSVDEQLWVIQETVVNTKDGLDPTAFVEEEEDDQEDYEVPNGSANSGAPIGSPKCSYSDFLELGESLLCFHSWYKRGHPFDFSEPEKAQKEITDSIRKMMVLIKEYVPRVQGTHWKLQKFHDLLHVASDMMKYGSPQNWDAGPGESSLKYWSKVPAKTCQKKGYKSFNKQVASRVTERQTMSRAKNAMCASGLFGNFRFRTNMEIKKPEPTVGPIIPTNAVPVFNHSSPTFVVNEEEDSDGQTTMWPSRKRKSTVDINPLVYDYFVENIPHQPDDEDITLEGVSEVKIGPKLFRAHPDYHSEGEWYEWVWVKYGRPNDLPWKCHKPNGLKDNDAFGPSRRNDVVPAKVLSFAKGAKDGKPKAIIHACDFRESNLQDSVLTEEWFLEYDNVEKKKRRTHSRLIKTNRPRNAVIRSIDCSDIVGRAFVVEEMPGIHRTIKCSSTNNNSDRVLLVVDKSLWPKRFT